MTAPTTTAGRPHPPGDRAERTAHILARLATARDDREKRRLRDDVVLVNLPVATSVALRYRNRGEALDDLIQVAHLGLIKAADGFDPHRGPDFLAYAVPTIRGEVRRHFRDRAWDIRPPRRIQELRVRVDAAAEELAQSLRRSPRPSEIADRLHVDVEDVAECLASAECYNVHSLDAPGDDTIGNGDSALAGTLGDTDPDLEAVDDVLSLRPLVARLPPRDRHIIGLRFWHGWTQAQIAEDIGVTQMQVSRLLAQALRRLRDQWEVAAEPDKGR
jgi:RNA polymerase sigma-B factor